jgi:hypothetical protein
VEELLLSATDSYIGSVMSGRQKYTCATVPEPRPFEVAITKSKRTVTDRAVSKRRIGKHVPTNAHPTIEGRLLLGNRLVNTYYSNECQQ